MNSNIYISQPEIKKMLQHFYNATGLRVGIHDPEMNVLIEHPVKPEQISEMGFCDVFGQYSKAYGYGCHNCDKKAYEQVRISKKPYIYKCHMGFTEAVIPIMSNGNIVSVLMIGQISTGKSDEQRFEKIVKSVKDVNIEEMEADALTLLKKAYKKIVSMDMEKFESFAYLLEICAQSIYDNRWIRCDEKSLMENFDEFIDANIYNSISIADVSKVLKVSRSHLSRLIHMHKDTTFTNYVLDKKVEAAKNMLLTTSMPVRDISIALGFHDPTYFMRVFKNKCGCTCGFFRKNNQR